MTAARHELHLRRVVSLVARPGASNIGDLLGRVHALNGMVSCEQSEAVSFN